METDSGDTAAGNYLELDVGTAQGTTASVSLQISQCAEIIRSGGVLHIAILGWAGLAGLCRPDTISISSVPP